MYILNIHITFSLSEPYAQGELFILSVNVSNQLHVMYCPSTTITLQGISF